MNRAMRNLLKNVDFVGVLIFVTLLNSFSIFRKFAWADDWAFISGYRSETAEVKFEHYSGYRPIMQKIMDLSFGNLSNYEHLIFLRLLSVIGMAVLTVLVMKSLEKYGYSRFIRVTLGCGLNLLPTFWIYTNWSSTFIYPWVCVISILSLNLFAKYKVISILLLVVAFMIYQPAAVFSVFLMFANYLRVGRFSRSSSSYLVGIVFSAVTSLILSKAINQALAVPTKARTGFLSDPIEIGQKVIWLATRPLALSFRPFIVESHGIVPLALMAAGFMLSIAGLVDLSRNRNNFKLIAGTGLFYIFGLLPIIPISENQIEFRILPTTSAMGLLLVILGAQSLQSKIQVPRMLAIPIVVLSIFGTTLYSVNKIQDVFIEPFKRNKIYLLEKSSGKKINKVVIVSDYNIVWPQRNYIGALSVTSDFQMPWVPIGEVSQILGIDESQIEVVVKIPSKELENTLIIDLDEFRGTL